MAQLFSSGVTPEYLKAMADAYAMYFPQQQTYNPQTQQTTTGTLTPEYQQALQQWYGAAASAPTAVIPSAQQSVVGGLFEDLYPQTRGGGGSRGYVDSNPAWTNMTDAEKANYYANNPTMASITQTLQNLWGNTSLGMLQNKLVPDFVANQRAIAMGVTPNPEGTLAGVPIVNQVVDPMQAAQAAAIERAYESRGDVGGAFGGNNPGYGDTGRRDSTGYDSGRTGTPF
jgi:hypothetical protein